MGALPGFHKELMERAGILYALAEGRITKPEATRLAAGDLIGDYLYVDVNEAVRRTADIALAPMDVEEIEKRFRGEREY